MKTFSIVGALLITLGVVGLIYKGVGYQKKEKVLHVGPFETTTKTETIPFYPWLSVALLVGGVVLVIAGNTQRKRLAIKHYQIP